MSVESFKNTSKAFATDKQNKEKKLFVNFESSHELIIFFTNFCSHSYIKFTAEVIYRYNTYIKGGTK